MTAAEPRGVEFATRRVLEVGVFLLPTLATVAYYLPTGLLMPARVLTVVLAVVAAVGWVRKPRATPLLMGVVAVSAVFVVFGAIGMLRFPESTSLIYASYAALIIVMCLTMALVGERPRIVAAFVWGWLVSAVVSAGVGLWEIATAQHLPGNLPAQTWAEKRPGYNEISAFFANPNQYAYHIVAVLLLLPVAWAMAERRWRFALIPFGLIELVLLWWTGGRIALVALAVGLGLWLLRWGWGRILAVGMAALIGVTALLNAPPGRTLLGYFHLDQFQLEGSSLWVRMVLLRSGLWSAQRADYLGAGPGGYEHWALDPANPHRFENLNNAHWGMLEVFVDYGVVALVALVGGLLLAAIVALRATNSRHEPAAWKRTAAIGVLVMAVSVVPLSLSNSTWLAQPVTAMHLGLMIALAAGAAAPSHLGDEFSGAQRGPQIAPDRVE